jgi:hypothetical protein
MKILSNIGEGSGSDYHRLYMPLKNMGADFVDKLDTNIVKGYDILWINRNCVTSPATLSLWREMFGLKIVFDLDDSLVIPDHYPGSQKMKPLVGKVVDRLIEADWVVVSTKDLVKEVLPYNTNVSVIPNRIDYKYFKCKEETFKEFSQRKIRVGFIGAFTHYYDWKEIKGWMKTLVSNPYFKDNCEFVMGGYNDSAKEYWRDFADLGKFIKSLSVNEYLRLFQEFDIILCPLVDNQFNRAKSSLRVLEAGTHNCVCILDSLYKDKSDCPDLGHIYVNKDKDWFDEPLRLVQDRLKLWQLKNWTGIKARQLDFQEIVKMRKEVLTNVKEVKKIETKYDIYSIRYDDKQPYEYKDYLNKVKTVQEKSWRFEYNVMLDIIPKSDTKDWIGLMSWKFPLKTLISKKKLEYILDNNQGYDCIVLCKHLNQSYLKFTEKQHPGFMYLFTQVCKDLGLPSNEPKHTIYSNFFVLKGDLYRKYVEEVVIPVTELLEGKYWKLTNRDAQYKAGLSKEKLLQFTGMEYYNFYTFILERLVGQWIMKNKLKVLNVFQ